MTKLFPTQFDTPTNSTVTSAEFVAEADGSYTVSGGATLVVNGVVAGASASIVEDDRVALRMVSSGDYASARHAVLSIDGVQQQVWTVVTVNDPTVYANPLFFDLDLYEIERDAQGVEYAPYSVYNRALLFNLIGAAGSVSLANGVKSPTPALTSSLPICSYYDKRVDLLGVSEKALVRSYAIEGRPYQAVRVPRDPNAQMLTFDTWVTVSDGARVDVIGSDHEKAFEIPTGTRPTGIAVSANYRHVWIANSADNTVLHLEWNGTTWTRTTVSVSQNPVYIVLDSLNNAYVSCFASDRLTKITPANVTSSIIVGQSPRGVFCSGAVVWAAVFGEGKIVRIEDDAIVAEVEVALCPYAVGQNADGTILASCFSTSELFHINPFGNNEITKREQVARFPYAIQNVDSLCVVSCLWQGTPELTYVLDQTPFRFTFDSPESVARNAAIRTNRFRVEGINVETPVSVSPMFNATVVKNGAAVGVNTTAVRGDTLQVNYTSPALPEEEFELELVVGTFSNVMQTKTVALDTLVDAFDIPAVIAAELNTEYTSQEVTISGLEVPTELSINSGILIKNGVALDSIAVEVQNGDKIQIRMTSAATNSTPVFSTLTVGAFEEVWSVFTKDEVGSTVYQPVIDAGKTLFDLINFNAQSANIDPVNDMLYRYNANTMGAPVEYAVTNAAVGNGSNSKENLYVMDAARKRVVFMDVDDASVPGVEAIYQLDGIPYAVTAGPMVAMGRLATSQYATVYDKDKIVKLGTNVSLPLISGAKPMGIACSNYNVMYVAGADGFLHVFTYDEGSKTFSFNTILGVPNGGRLCDLMFDDTSLFVSDLTSGSVHKLVSGFYVETVKVGHLPYAMAQSDTHVFTANFGSASVSKFPKSNGAGAVVTVNLPPGASQPTSITVDKARNRLFVACPREKRIYELNADTLAVTRTINALGYIWGLQMRDSSLMALSMWGNLLEKNAVGAVRTSPTSLMFAPQMDVDVDEALTSNSARVLENLVLPEQLWVEPFTDVALMKNGVNVGHSTTVVKNDRIEVIARSPNSYDSVRSVHVYSYKHNTAFEMLTTEDVFPDYIVFPTVQNAVVKDMVESDTMEVSGLADGVSVRCIVSMSAGTIQEAELELFINDAQVDPTAELMVKNGDTLKVRLRVVNVSWNGNSLYVLFRTDRPFDFGEFAIRTAYLEGAVRPPNGWMHDYPMGTAIEDGYHHAAQSPEAGYDRMKIIGEEQISGVERDAVVTTDSVHSLLDAVLYDIEAMQSILEVVDVLQTERNAVGTVADTDIEGYDRAEDNTATFVDVSGYSRAEFNPMTLIDVDSYEVTSLYSLETSQEGMPADGYMSSAAGAIKIAENAGWLKHLPVVFTNTSRALYDVFEPNVLLPVRAEYEKIGTYGVWEFKVAYSRHEYFNAHDVFAAYYIDNMYSTAEFSVSYMGHSPLSQIPVVNKWLQSALHSFHVVNTFWRYVPMLHTEKFGATAEKLRTRSMFDVASSYDRRVLRHINFMDDVGYDVREIRAIKLNTDVQYIRPANIGFDDFTYTAAWERAFDTEEAAIAAGLAFEHPTVYGKQLYDNFWMWHIPGLITRVECANTSLRPTVVKGYVQGG